ncbi:MAG TPA: zf-HC2 domain-containing protein, partial [Burkholderiales bacterium]
MLSCKETSRLLSQREDRALGFGERVALRVHLAICDGCRNA